MCFFSRKRRCRHLAREKSTTIMAASVSDCSQLVRVCLSRCAFGKDFRRFASVGWCPGKRCGVGTGNGLPPVAYLCKRTLFGRRMDLPLGPEYELVYKCGSGGYLLTGVLVSEVCAVPLSVETYRFLFDIKFATTLDFSESSIMQSGTDLVIVLGGFWLVALSMFLLTRTYPLRIYHDAKAGRFVLVHQSLLPFRCFEKECLEGEVRPTSWVLCQILSLYRLRKGFVYLDQTAFRLPAHFNSMLGHVKKE